MIEDIHPVSLSYKNKAYFLGVKALTQSPVEEVVVQIAITWHELELLKELLIVHDVKSIEDVKIVCLSLEQSIFHDLLGLVLGRNVEKRIRRL